jgi:catechol 2,3-dioxygenase
MRAFLPDETRITQVRLRIPELQKALEFYSGVLGLSASHGPGAEVQLSASPQKPGLVVLTEDPNASPRLRRSTGLYHFAILYPTRSELAQAYRRIVNSGYSIDGASDHGVSEAIYLSDPDGNGVELYADRPRSQWQWHNGHVAMVTTPLDLDNLLATVAGAPKAERALLKPDLGHIHLHVADLAAAERFYSEFLGFTVTQRSYPGALFFAAGGYHHHIAANVWAGKSAPRENSVGLISYRIEVPVAEILYCLGHRAPLHGYETRTLQQDDGHPILQIRDPNGHWLEVESSQPLAATAAGAYPTSCERAAS